MFSLFSMGIGVLALIYGKGEIAILGGVVMAIGILLYAVEND